MTDFPPAPDPADAEAELLRIDQEVQEINQAMRRAERQLMEMSHRRAFLQGVLAHARTFDAGDVQVESDAE